MSLALHPIKHAKYGKWIIDKKGVTLRVWSGITCVFYTFDHNQLALKDYKRWDIILMGVFALSSNYRSIPINT